MHIKDFKIKIGDMEFNGNRIVEYDGFQRIKAEYELAKNALGNGSIVMGTYMPEREMSLNVRVKRDMADTVLRYFKPQKTYVAQIEDRKANVKIETAEIKYGHGLYNDPFLELEMIAPDPFFYDVSDFGRNIAGIVPQFGFPWRYSPDNPVKFGYKEFTDKTVFANNGDEKVGAKFRIEAKGDVQNVKIENLRTKQFLKVNQTLHAGDVLEISTVAEDSYILLNGNDIFDQIDRLSNFFKLETGDNFLQYSADTGVTEMDIYLYYRPKYLAGVEDIEI